MPHIPVAREPMLPPWLTLLNVAAPCDQDIPRLRSISEGFGRLQGVFVTIVPRTSNTTFGLVRICPCWFFRHLIQCQSSGWSSYSHTISSSASSSEISISVPTAVPSCCFFLLEALFRLRCGLPSLGKLMASKKASLSI